MNARANGHSAQEADLYAVRLLQVPLDLYGRATEHHEELKREFALIAAARPAQREEIPARLLKLVAELRQQFGAFTAAPTGELQQALRRGDATVDVSYQMPAAAGDAAVEFERLLDEADEFCERGSLLTLATPRDVAAFRRWFLGEFAAQIGGRSPTPWPAFRS